MQRWRCGWGTFFLPLAATPRFLEQARGQLVDADPIFIKVGIEENDGNIDLIQNAIAPAIPAGSKLKTQFDQVAPARRLKRLKNFSGWLKNDACEAGKLIVPGAWEKEWYGENSGW